MNEVKPNSSSAYLFHVDEKLVLHSALKRAFDILLSLLALCLCVPLFLLLYLLIKTTSKGPMFYCSSRIGRQGKLFKFWKLRSMYLDADERLETILNTQPELREEWNKYYKLKQDPRLTPIGKFLRSTSLDELPQCWNVLIGDLSLVGPRPYLPREMPMIGQILGKDVEQLFSVRPGLTGIWQTSGRNQLTFEERVKLEVTYAAKRSFFFDLKLIAKTIPALFLKRGAF